MTDLSDWEFRAAHMKAAAARLERKAQDLIDEAVEFRRVADRCDAAADRMRRDGVNK